MLRSAGNFVLADVGESGQRVYERLLRHGVIVRPVAGYGLPRCVRITVGTAAQNERLLQALAASLDPGMSGPDRDYLVQPRAARFRAHPHAG